MKLLSLFLIFLAFFLNSCHHPKSGDTSSEETFAPDWARGIVWYQIFPERFRNGDTTNDPTYADIQGAWPHDTVLPWQVHPWEADWYELQPYEKANGKDIWYNLTRRRYGGDLQGIMDKLDYLQALGIGAIYLNPIFWASSSHKGDAICYHHVDPTFGSDPIGDKVLMSKEIPDDTSTWVWTKADLQALQLIEEIHARGMKVIFDGVFNHMGLQSFAFQDVLKNQQNSEYKDWFIIKSWEDSTAGTHFDYKGAPGAQEFPGIREDDNGIVSGPKEYIFSSVKKWMKPVVNGEARQGIDGWRLDAASSINHHFWKEFRIFTKNLNPDCYLTAEVIDKEENTKPYLQGDEFDAVMNYNFAFHTTDYFVHEQNGISTTTFASRMNTLLHAYPVGVVPVLMNLFDSHDANRIASQIVNKDLESLNNGEDYFAKSNASNPDYITTQPSIDEYKQLKMLVIFQMTWPGAPMIYYGDEVGMWGANDPDCRKPMLWNDIIGKREKHLADGRVLNEGNVVYPNQEMLVFYKKMIRLRNTEPALKIGSVEEHVTDDNNKLYGFTRAYGKTEIYIIMNNDSISHSYNLKLKENGDYLDMISHVRYRSNDNSINVKIQPKWGVIIKKD